MKKTLLMIMLALPTLSHANMLFYCKTTNGKTVKVEKQEDIVSYAFGRDLQQPELALKKPITEVEIFPRGFSGGSYANVVTFDNGDYSYELHIGEQFDTPGKDKRYGLIWVYRNGHELAEIKCIPTTIPKSVLMQ